MKLEEARKEYYRRRAREEGYKSRAAYKLLEAIQKYRLIREGDIVIDLGCAPGGWVQAAAETVGEAGVVIGVDLTKVALAPAPNVHLIQADINEPAIVEKIRGFAAAPRKLPVDVLLSDLSPNVSGVWELDHYRQTELTLRSLAIGESLLKVGGKAMLKVFEGERFTEVERTAKGMFQVVHIMKPRASRRESSEMYLICLGRRPA
jgi:23S rRNA (uridine2552-2'-O)-methyltransferase